jgi:hypothetical protein
MTAIADIVEVRIGLKNLPDIIRYHDAARGYQPAPLDKL